MLDRRGGARSNPSRPSSTASFRASARPRPASTKVPAHIRLTRVEVHQGMGPKFEAYLAKLKAAQDKVGGTPPVVRYVTALGPANVYTAAYYFDKYAQWDGAPAIADVLRKAYGEAEAAILEETARTCIKSLETYRPRLPGGPEHALSGAVRRRREGGGEAPLAAGGTGLVLSGGRLEDSRDSSRHPRSRSRRRVRRDRRGNARPEAARPEEDRPREDRRPRRRPRGTRPREPGRPDRGRRREAGRARASPRPPGASVVDLSKKTVLPGLIDVHTHVTSQPEDYYADRFRRRRSTSPSRRTSTRGGRSRPGFTTLRVVGAPEYVDVALRNAIDKGTGRRAAAEGRGPRDRVDGRPRRPHGLLAVPEVRAVLGRRRRRRRRPQARPPEREVRRGRHQDDRLGGRPLRGGVRRRAAVLPRGDEGDLRRGRDVGPQGRRARARDRGDQARRRARASRRSSTGA